MAEVIKTTFQLKRGSSAAWTRVNPILAQGEPGYELDTGKLKIGDGVTPWNSLRYLTDDIYTKQEVDDLISQIQSGVGSFNWEVF